MGVGQTRQVADRRILTVCSKCLGRYSIRGRQFDAIEKNSMKGYNSDHAELGVHRGRVNMGMCLDAIRSPYVGLNAA